MAKNNSKRNPAFSSKFKTLVKDVKILRRSSHKDAANGTQHRDAGAVASSQNHDHNGETPSAPLDLDTIPSNRDQETIASSQDPAVAADLTENHQSPATSHQDGQAAQDAHDDDEDDHAHDVEVLDSEGLSEEPVWSTDEESTDEEQEPEKPGLSVQLSLNFQGSMGFSYNQNYETSIAFIADERLMRGLLRRIDHGCFELITRTDPNATKSSKDKGKDKPLRFEMVFAISQKGDLYATRTYKSYQQEPVTIETVKETALSSHRLIGLFLKRHDPEFVWKDGPIYHDVPEGPETSPYHFKRVQPMNCIPRSRFLEESQKFEAVPGFMLEMKLISRHRKHSDWTKTIKVNSKQSTPLNLAVAEALFFDASYELETAFRARRGAVEDRHRSSCGLTGGICSHYEERATEITLKMSNNIGPEFTHLERTIHSNLALFSHSEPKESAEFVKALEHTLRDARDTADQIISNMNDLEFRIVQLKGKGWVLDKPIVFTVGPSNQLSRHTVQAILDRVQVGVADALKGAAVMVRLTASKRGHFILDKTLIVRALAEDANPVAAASQTRKQVVSRVKRRVQEDMDMICKDTCSLDTLDDNTPRPTVKVGPTLSLKSDLTDPQAASLHPPKTPNSESHRSSEHGGPIPSSPGSHTGRSPPRTLGTASPVKSEYSERSESAPIYRTKSGSRAFPLIPTPTSYGFPESPKPELKRHKTPSMEQEIHPPIPNRTSSKSQSSPKHNDGDEVSLAPSTPSLVSAHSTQSSSVVFTPPKTHDKHYADEHLAAKGIADARTIQKHGFPTHPRSRPPPSPLHQHQETRAGEDKPLEEDGATVHLPRLALFPKPPAQPVRAAPEVPTPTSDKTVKQETPVADQETGPTGEPTLFAPAEVVPGESLRRHSDSGMNPIRSPVEFDFSSPWPSPPHGTWEEAIDDSPERTENRTLVPHASNPTLARPTTPKSNNMFGSAGLLGFRPEPQVIGVGLRRALMTGGSVTTKSMSFINHMQHARHASLFLKPSNPYADVELMKRPVSSSGSMVHVDMEGRRLRKSASVAALGDMVLVKQPPKALPAAKKDDSEDNKVKDTADESEAPSKETKRARSSSWMFLRAALG